MPPTVKQHTFDVQCVTPGCGNHWSYTSGEDRASPSYEKCLNCGKEGVEQGKHVGLVITKQPAAA